MFKRLYLIVILSLVTASCSRLSLALKWADFFVAQYADSYFDLNSQQKKVLKTAINDFIAEGKKVEFQNIAKTLAEMADTIDADKMNEENILRFKNKIQFHFSEFFAHLAPYMAESSGQLKQENWTYYLKIIEKEISEKKDEIADLKKDQKKRIERLNTNFEYWLGDLTDENKQAIQDFVKANPYNWDLYLKNKANLATKLAEPSLNLENRKEFVKKLLSDFNFGRDAEYLEYQKGYQEKVYQLTKLILIKASPAQRKNMVENLRKLSTSFSQASE